MVLVNGFDAWLETPARPRRAVVAALRARTSSIPTARRASRRFAAEPWPTWTFAARGRHARRARRSSCRTASRRASVTLAAARRRRTPRDTRPARRAAAALGPRLSRHASRERRAARSSRGVDGRRWSAGTRTTACRRSSRAPTRATSIGPTGIGSSSTRRSASAASTTREDLVVAGRADLRRSADGDAVWLLAPRAQPARSPTPSADVVERDRGAARGRARAPRRVRRRRSHRAADAYLVRARRAAGRSSPAIRGSPTGAATRSSRCAACAWRPAGSTTRATSSLEWCRRGVGGHAAEPLPRRRRARRSSTPSTPRCGSSSRVARAARRGRRRRRDARRRRAIAPRCATAVAAILEGYARGTRYGIRADADGLLACGVPGRAAHVDGRASRRLGGDAAHRQAGRGPGALAATRCCAARSSARPIRRVAGTRGSSCGARRPFGERFWNDADRLPLRRRRRRSRAGPRRRDACRPNQIFAVGGLAASRCSTASARGRSSTPSSAPVDAARPALAGARRAGLRRRATRGRPRRATRPTTRARCGPG